MSYITRHVNSNFILVIYRKRAKLIDWREKFYLLRKVRSLNPAKTIFSLSSEIGKD